MSATHTAPAPAVTERRALRTALWVIQVLLAAFFVFAATAKLSGQKDAVETFTKLGLGQWFRYLTGACELAGGLGLLIPRLSGLAALGLVGVMIGATITNLVVLAPAVAPMTVLLGAVFALIA